jgi:N-methylhydantoinase B
MWLVETVATAALSRLAATDASYIREAQASPNGGPDLYAFFGHNQYGEHFHGALLDMIYVGGGAYSHRDGLTPQGHRHIPALRLQNVEANEQIGPFLYLYRRFTADSAGPGRNRGGASVGVGYVLHDIDQMDMRLACHCYESPTSFGLFGGYPGGTNRRRFLKDAGADTIIAGGDLPFDTSGIPGEVLTLPAKVSGSIKITNRDIYECGPSAGAGWGDPVERAPKLVAEDVHYGFVSSRMAEEIYGVVIDANGKLDENATRMRRDAIRAERLSWMKRKTMTERPARDAKGDRPPPSGPVVMLVH